MKFTALLKLLPALFLAGVICTPLAGCGTSVESEPVGVEDDGSMEEEFQDEEYIAGEEEGM